MSTFPDHFSESASAYAAFRPTYPLARFDWIARESPHHRLAWDCATGSGQEAEQLVTHFDEVVATDASVAQLAHCPRGSPVH